ncbi:MAG: hypothetical protein RMK01_01715 [Thermomicrobium sp.]|nr:hypothetical protein [Thermomicrobium sp.]MDW8058773.1 hypothetical protein [Thermomicrobium sp.]
MRTAALVFGTIGGIVGIAVAFLLLGFGSLGAAFDAEASGRILGGALIAMLVGALGIVGAVSVRTRPGTSAVLQGIAAVAGLFAVGLFWIPAAALFALGALAGLAGRRTERRPATD